MSFEAPKGTHDVLPREWPAWQRVLDEAERLCGAYGYRRMATPTFEETELFARSSGEASDVVSKEMYPFADRVDRCGAFVQKHFQHGKIGESQA